MENELNEWRPSKRYRIEEGELKALNKVPIYYLAKAIPARRHNLPIFELVGPTESGPEQELDPGLFSEAIGPIVVIVDQNVATIPTTSWLLRLLSAQGRDSIQISVLGGEDQKSLDNAMSLLEQVHSKISRPVGAFFIIGGGCTLNLGGFVASVTARGVLPTVLVPTTIMAMADVAVGSKTAVNLGANQTRPLAQKHAIGTFHNPTAVLLIAEYIRSLSEKEIFLGLSEVLKHAYAQDEKLFLRLATQLESTSFDRMKAYQDAKWAMEQKSELLSLDPWESNQSLILQIGHLHAHALERVTDFGTPHGYAVYWGMLIDSLLCGTIVSNSESRHPSLAANYFERLLRTSMARDSQPKQWPSADDLLDGYRFDMKWYHHSQSGYVVVNISRVGEISAYPTSLPLRQIDRAALRDAIQAALTRVQHEQ